MRYYAILEVPSCSLEDMNKLVKWKHINVIEIEGSMNTYRLEPKEEKYFEEIDDFVITMIKKGLVLKR